MSYSVRTEGCYCIIEQENLAKAYELMCELNQQNHLKSGCEVSFPKKKKSPSGQPDSSVWFVGLDWNYPETLSDAQQILEQLGFEVSVSGNGDLSIVNFEGQQGDERHFFEALSPAIKEGSLIHWMGDDGEQYRWWFTNGDMIVERAVISVTWVDEDDCSPAMD